MTFSNPWALLLLALIPLFVVIAWPYRNPLQRVQDMASLVVRCLLVALLVLALAGISRAQRSEKLATLFLIDVSDSVGSDERARSMAYVRQAVEGMGDEDAAGIVLFGADALVERPISPGATWQEPASIPLSSHTNIANAIRLGITLFPEDAARRMILLSDGGDTGGNTGQGDARQAAQLAQANDIQLSVVTLPPSSGDEIRLEALDAPALLYEGEEFDLAVTIHSNVSTEVPLQITSRGQLVAQQSLTVQPGENSFVLPLVAGESGFSSFQARIAPARDTQPQNNMLDAYSEVRGPPAVLLVAADPDEGRPLAGALRQSGLTVQEINPAQMPSDLGQLSRFRAVLLVNVPAPSLMPRQLTLLQTYVRDLGHGLVVVGGENSYGPGGYFQTPLEETLPVQMTIDDTERLPPMSLMMVIDKSGSMDSGGTGSGGTGSGGLGSSGGTTKVELAKEAIARTLDLLLPHDRMGVVAFSDSARWVVRPTPANDKSEILSAVGAIRASGGTDILAGLEMAGASILEEPTEVRHIILLSDGVADEQGILELVQALAENGITTSVVAIGQGYSPLLDEVARVGGGRFHFTDSPEVIPQIFALETTLATRSYVVEERFTPAVVGSSPILRGISGLPALEGYVATSPKLTAQVVLEGGVEGDPLLAQWQYGLGRAVAWSSDAKGQWAAAWIGWPEFVRFWSQAVRWTIVESSRGVLESQVRMEGDDAIVSAEVLQPNGNFGNDLALELSLIAPDLDQQTLRLQQVAPGLYEGRFQPTQTGTYLLNVTGREQADLAQSGAENEDEESNENENEFESGAIIATQTRGFVMAYSPEYRATNIDETLLPDLAAIGNGAELPIDQPSAAFDHTLARAQSTTPLWPWFLAVAALLLPVDVGLRRLTLGISRVKPLLANLQGWWAGAKPTQSKSAPSSAGNLLNIKRQREQVEPEDVRSGQAATRPTTANRRPLDAQALAELASASAQPPHGEGSVEKSDPEEVSTVRQLMKAKQRSRRQ